MKVVQINAVFGIMSTGRSTKELSDFLNSHGHQCISYYGENPGNWENAYYIGSWIEHKFHALISRILGRRGYGSIITTLRLIRRLKNFSPDVVHLQNLHSNFINIPILLRHLSKHNIPTVITLHDCFFFTGGCTHYTLNQCMQWKEKCTDCRFLHKGKDYWFINGASADFEKKRKLFSSIPRLAIIGVSDWILEQSKQSQILGNASLFSKIYNWIDLDIFRPIEQAKQIVKDRLHITDKFMILGISATWTAPKGLFDILELSKILPKDSVIVLIGRIPTNVDIPDNIISLPRTNNIHELAELYSAADVFIHLSREETFGKVTAEALACGTPCVVYNSTANPELIGEKCGYVIDTIGDIAGVLNAVKEVQKCGKQSYSEHCRQHTVRAFNRETNIRQHIDLYQELINK